jgi:hypothetical protein
MGFFWIGIGALVLRLGVAAWMDLKARRAGRPIRGVDDEANLDARRVAESELHMRGHNQNPYYGGGGF